MKKTEKKISHKEEGKVVKHRAILEAEEKKIIAKQGSPFEELKQGQVVEIKVVSPQEQLKRA